MSTIINSEAKGKNSQKIENLRKKFNELRNEIKEKKNLSEESN